MSQKTKTILKSFLVLALLVFSVNTVFSAWQAPTAVAPGGNTFPPLNVGSTTQTKAGTIALNALNVFVGTTLSGQVRISGGTPLAGEVLTAVDGTGLVTWSALPAGGGSQTPWTSNINAAGFTLNGNSIASGNLTLNSTSNATKGYVLINPTGGNVGIGTLTPSQRLDVNGKVRIRGGTPGSDKVLTSVDATGLAEWRTPAVGGGGGGLQSPWTSNINANGFTLNGNDGPFETLTLNGTSHNNKGAVNINPNGGGAIIGYAGSAAEGRGLTIVKNVTGLNIVNDEIAQLFLTGDLDVGLLLGYQTVAGYSFLQSSDKDSFGGEYPPISLNPYGGNVGIGTITPTQKLSVAGIIESKSGGFKFPDGTIQTSAHGKIRYTNTSPDFPTPFNFAVPAGVTKVWVTASGGGGGGGNSNEAGEYGGGGGGAHAVIAEEINVTGGSSVVGWVGYGGVGATDVGTNGGNGSNSRFGGFYVAGGNGGVRYAGSGHGEGGGPGGLGGTPGNSGAGGRKGGDSIFGDSTDAVGSSGKGFGSGGNGAGSGAFGSTNTGGTGAPGFVLVEW